jgi:antitoxin component YwqK of YwqJK toxin-antitoxin module
MKIYSIAFLCLLFINYQAQTIEPDLEYYNSGQLKWKGQKQCITIKDDKECKPTGFWVHYYKNGEKKLELLENVYKNNTSAPTSYINMWQQDGFQILKNGIGFYFEKDNRGSGEYDSSSYQIKDSLWNGLFFHYRKHGASDYYLIETGQYSDAKRYGTFKFRDTVKLYEEETNYDEKETSTYKYFHSNFKVKEEGKTLNGKKEGLCKFYNDKGTLISEVNYKNGAEFGEYKEYHENGVLKVKGQYKHTSGFVTHTTFDAGGKENIRKTASDNIPKKYGEWKYYDEKGNLIKSETLK